MTRLETILSDSDHANLIVLEVTTVLTVWSNQRRVTNPASVNNYLQFCVKITFPHTLQIP